MRTKIGSLLLVAVFFVAMTANAQTPQNRQDRQKRMMHRDLRAQAEKAPFFTEEQKEAIKEIRLETDKEMKPLRNELRELNARQQTLTTEEGANLEAIYENIEKMADVKTEMAKIRAKQHQEVRGLLTEEQLLKFDNRRQMMQKKGHHSFKNGAIEGVRNFERPGRG